MESQFGPKEFKRKKARSAVPNWNSGTGFFEPECNHRFKLHKFNLGCGAADGVGRGVEGVLDAVAENRKNGDNDEGDERDEQAVFDQSLALFFLNETIEHSVYFLLKKLEAGWDVRFLANSFL
ncbi:hypothetical protein [Abditibacterium utsteinense]|uniref:hypothetical protein n=1 Tax=Abditibacterium utsteinense TaxID=1960156 RepID=UPI001EE71DA2|nr:hypothetical protein [Abditibacterium utsteinense]